MSVNHRRSHVPVSEQFLHYPNVVMVFEQMSSEAVSQRMARAALIYSGEQDGLFDRTGQIRPRLPIHRLLPILRRYAGGYRL